MRCINTSTARLFPGYLRGDMHTLILPLFTTLIAWVVWRITRNLFIYSPLDNVPGPSSRSYVKGKFILTISLIVL